MKFTARAALAALITTSAAASVLALSGPALASATPPAPSKVLYGTWRNTNAKTLNIRDIVVTPRHGGIVVDGFGACSPTACEWGNIGATVFGTGVSSPTGKYFRANWNFGFSHTVLLASLSRPRGIWTLTVQEFTTFIPSDGRSNYTVTERFVKARRGIRPSRVGKTAADYPLGDWVKPASTLIGPWRNVALGGGNIPWIVLGLDPTGSLNVHAYGNCVPSLCDWGQVSAATYGTSISSTSGQVFLAFYRFGFATKLISGSLNRQGTRLTIQTYTEFTDHSGRANYVITDTFVPAVS